MANEGSLPPDRAIRIATAIESIERDLNRLFDIQNCSLADYLAEGNQDTRDIVERRFETLTEATLDVARQLIKQEGQRVPARRQAVIDALVDLDIVDAALAEKLRNAVEFRDVLAHTCQLPWRERRGLSVNSRSGRNFGGRKLVAHVQRSRL